MERVPGGQRPAEMALSVLCAAASERLETQYFSWIADEISFHDISSANLNASGTNQ
jgi:hypothetical protein